MDDTLFNEEASVPEMIIGKRYAFTFRLSLRSIISYIVCNHVNIKQTEKLAIACDMRLSGHPVLGRLEQE